MPPVISSTTMAPLGFARSWIKRRLRLHKNSRSSAESESKTCYSLSSTSSSSWLPSSSPPETISPIASTASVAFSSTPPVQTQPGTHIESSVERSTVALHSSTSPTSFLQPSHSSSVSSLLSPQSQMHLPVAHCFPPPPARLSSIPLHQPVRATSARSAKKSLSSATSKDAILTNYQQAAASKSAPFLKTATYLQSEQQFKHTVINSPSHLPHFRPSTPSYTQPLVPAPRDNVRGHTDGPSFKSDPFLPSLPPHHSTRWIPLEQLRGSQQNNRSFASLPTQLLSSSPFSFFWSTAQQLKLTLGSNRNWRTGHPSNAASFSSSFSRQHHRRNPSAISQFDHYLYRSHQSQPTMSTSHRTAAPPPLQHQKNHLRLSQRQQQIKIYSCQPTNMFRSLSSRFGASTETLPVVETVAQEYARTIKALWRMVEEEELSQRIADAPTEEERERIILEHTQKQQQQQQRQHHQQQCQEQCQYKSCQHQRSPSSSWLVPSLMQAQFHSSQGSSRQSAASAATAGSRSSLATIQQSSQVALIKQMAALKGDTHHSMSKGDPAAALATLQRSRTVNDTSSTVRQKGRHHSQQPYKPSCPQRHHHPLSSPATMAVDDPAPTLFQRRSAPQPSRTRFSQISDATSACECKLFLSGSSSASLDSSTATAMNDSECKLQRSHTDKTSKTVLISSSVQQCAHVLQKHDHMTIEERLLLEEDWRLQAKLLRSADIFLTTPYLCGSQQSLDKVPSAAQQAITEDPDRSAHVRGVFSKEFTEYEPALERQDEKGDEDAASGRQQERHQWDSESVDDLTAQDPLRRRKTSFASGEKEDEEDEIVVATKVGVRSSRLMQWGAAATTTAGESSSSSTVAAT